MADDRIGELRIRIRTATAGDEHALRREAEQFARSVLERALQFLEERAPGRVIFLRRLPLRWSVAEDVFGDEPRIETLASELADSLESSMPLASDTPSPSADAVVFRDEAHHLASYLVARARGEQAWFHRSLEQGPGFAAVVASRPAVVIQALELLSTRGGLAEVLFVMPPSELRALQEEVERLSPASATPLVAEKHAAGSPGSLPASLRQIAATYRALRAPARALALHVEARRIAGASASTAEVARAVEAVLRAGQLEAMAPEARGDPAREALEGDASARSSRSLASRKAADVAEDTSRLGHDASHPSQSTRSRSEPRGTHESPQAQADESLSPRQAIRFGGLFFLLNPLLELEIPEALWRACLPEGEVLAYLARELLGPSGAKAAALIGGVPPLERPPEISPEQQAEFTANTTRQLVAALPRRGLASIPEIVVSLQEHPAGRLLCASAMGSPFVLFAWPAESRDGLTEGLGQILAIWPSSSRIHAAPALASLAPTSRIRPLPREHRPVPLHIAKSSTPAAAALLAQAIGAPCQLFLSRAGEQVDSVGAFTARFLARDARVLLLDGQMQVRFSGAAIDMALRKPGLDRDPGWITWLERTVRFEFDTDEL